MEKMNLITYDFDSKSECFPLWSVIYVRINEMCFPDNQWWDCTSSVLDMWMENLHRLICGSCDSCMLYFMDGDYAINLTIEGTNAALVECISPKGNVAIRETIDLLHFARQLLATEGKIKKLYERSFDSRMLQRLSYRADKLRDVIK